MASHAPAEVLPIFFARMPLEAICTSPPPGTAQQLRFWREKSRLVTVLLSLILRSRQAAMMCRRCGYTEFYVKEPGSVQPVGKRAIEINGPEAGPPYR